MPCATGTRDESRDLAKVVCRARHAVPLLSEKAKTKEPAGSRRYKRTMSRCVPSTAIGVRRYWKPKNASAGEARNGDCVAALRGHRQGKNARVGGRFGNDISSSDETSMQHRGLG